MPVTTPDIKVDAVRYWGGIVVLNCETFDDAYAHALKLEKENGLTFVHPYDDSDVIAGQGTIGVEILHQHPEEIEAIFVPIGGTIRGRAVFANSDGFLAPTASSVLRPSISLANSTRESHFLLQYRRAQQTQKPHSDLLERHKSERSQ